MFVNQNNCDELIFRKHPNYILIWLTFICLLLISLMIIGFCYKYNKFYQLNGLTVKEGSDNYVHILLENDKLDIIKNNNLMFNKEIIDFKYEISSYLYSDSGKAYREIKLFFENDFINGEIINLSFKSPPTTLIKEIKSKVKKGMM